MVWIVIQEMIIHTWNIGRGVLKGSCHDVDGGGNYTYKYVSASKMTHSVNIK